jgi:methionyl-tRNA formyltransferase
LDAGHDVALVLTQPDRRAGRGMREVASLVKNLALARGLEVYQPQTLRTPEAAARLSAVRAEAMVVAAYGLMLPRPVLNATRHGGINIHASLLPRWRGAAPIQRAILAGDAETGVSIMQMDEGLDTGPVFATRALPIGSDDDFASLHDKLAELGARLLLEVLASLKAGNGRATAQPEAGATYAAKIQKSETALRWSDPASSLERAVRAFRPSPGAVVRFGGMAIKLWRARVSDGAGAPGAVLDAKELRVACGSGALVIEELQPAGGRRMATADFIRGHRVEAGMRFE